jgi:N-acetylglucosaminyldiphosphoundecaprenol N-acetyl-beta-D-mannosaminyltransferase
VATDQALIDHPRELDATPVPPAAEGPLSPPPKVPVAGIGASRTSYTTAARLICDWAERRESRYVTVTSAHGIVMARSDRRIRDILNSADLVTPDGMPVVWTMRMSGAAGQARVYGPTLMLHACAAAAERGVPVYFYGAVDSTLELLSDNLTRKFPGLRIAGAFAPPFRPLTRTEDADVVRRIRESEAGIVFVGLSTPKQELWMAEHVGSLKSVLIGVGAAFDFHAGTLRQAPAWLQRRGLEWLFRLFVERRRLWRRYARIVPMFGAMALAQILRNDRGESNTRRGRRK